MIASLGRLGALCLVVIVSLLVSHRSKSTGDDIHRKDSPTTQTRSRYGFADSTTETRRLAYRKRKKAVPQRRGVTGFPASKLAACRTKSGPCAKREDPTFPITLVMAWSTGHCGTTTLASPDSYVNASHVNFFHEKIHLKREEWTLMTRSAEKKWVSNTFLPFVSSQVSAKSPVYFDPGHHIVYFIFGLIKAIAAQDRIKLSLCSVLCWTEEEALSLTFGGDEKAGHWWVEWSVRQKEPSLGSSNRLRPRDLFFLFQFSA